MTNAIISIAIPSNTFHWIKDAPQHERKYRMILANTRDAIEGHNPGAYRMLALKLRMTASRYRGQSIDCDLESSFGGLLAEMSAELYRTAKRLESVPWHRC